MPNHISVAHNRLESSNHLTITHDRTFNGKPLYYHKDGLVLEHLEDIDRVLAEALGQYPKLCVAHFNVRLQVTLMETIPRSSVVSFVSWSRKPMSCV